MLNVLETIRDARQNLLKQGEVPSKVRLTRQDESSLCWSSVGQIGDTLYSRLLTEGPRATFRTIYGMTVFWDSPKFEVL